MNSFKSFLIVVILAVSASPQTSSTNPKHQAGTKQAGTIEYRNKDYGFSFTLPASWQGYSVRWTHWLGSVPGHGDTLQGPQLIFRHPEWTQDNPREDIPIMIFTIAQWEQDPIASAAPIGPSELGRNRKYVFAVMPRWDYDFSEGYEEAEKILTPASLHTFAPAGK